MLGQINKIIIIVGCQRSGTTLLGHIIGAPEHSLLLDETDVVCLDDHGGYENWLPALIDNDSHAKTIFNSILTQARNQFREPDSRIVKSGKQYALGRDIKQLVLKAPNLTYSFNDIAKLKKPVSVLYVVRNPLSVVSSMLKLDHIDFIGNQLKLIRNHPELCKQYTNDVTAMSQSSSSLWVKAAHLWSLKSSLFPHFENRGILSTLYHYENLIINKQQACIEISQKLGIQYDGKMINHHHIYQGIAQGRTDRERSIDRASLEKWKNNISNQQASKISVIALVIEVFDR